MLHYCSENKAGVCFHVCLMLAHDDDIMPDYKSGNQGAPTLDPALNHPHYNKYQAQKKSTPENIIA